MNNDPTYAPGWPGLAPKWTSSAKSGVGTALTGNSRIWYTLSHGILNEVYYRRLDHACIRDMGLLVADGQDFFSEEKRDTTSKVSCPSMGVPYHHFTNTCKQGRYRIEKEIIADPERDSVLQRIKFVPMQGKLEDYHLYALLAPHIDNQGMGNTAWVGQHKGITMLFAQREGIALALACSVPWGKCSAGFAGVSDGWHDISQNKQMTWEYNRAENGNVALTGEIDLAATKDGTFTLSLAFGLNPDEAGYRALAGLDCSFEELLPLYVKEWSNWQNTLINMEGIQKDPGCDMYRVSTAVLRTHEAKGFPGGIIASLSIPWGDDKGDDDLGGYHLVWPRDLCETAGGFLAAGGKDDAHRILHYLQAAQEANGHWAQNMWMDTLAFWTGVQMDETGLPVLLVKLAEREGALGPAGPQAFWEMVRKAASCIVRFGPVTQEDRWEEDEGYTAFTLAVEICALVIAAEYAERFGEPDVARYLLETADAWNDSIERWTYCTDTDIARQVGVEGYYIRIAPPQMPSSMAGLRERVLIANKPAGQNSLPASQLVSTDTLALVRFGLRAPDDPRILNTVKVIDAMLKVETPLGTSWHRYNQDGYGEHEDGSAYDGTGVGRAWPLLSGERAHYELAAGNKAGAEKLIHDMETFANDGGMIPEQVWDTDPIPERGLLPGEPTGSAMPLVWAHAEYIKLLRSVRDNKIFDMPEQVAKRYITDKTGSAIGLWRFNNKSRQVPHGRKLRIEVLDRARVHWSDDDWQTSHDTDTTDTKLGLFIVDLPTEQLTIDGKIVFTFFWIDQNRWEGANYAVSVV